MASELRAVSMDYFTILTRLVQIMADGLTHAPAATLALVHAFAVA